MNKSLLCYNIVDCLKLIISITNELGNFLIMR